MTATMYRPAMARWVAPSIVAGAVAVDQLTKAWAVSTRPVQIVGDDFELHAVRNSGAAFSLTTATLMFTLLAAALSFALVRAVARASDPRTVVALSLVLGGALGNLIDRVARGAVVDFIGVGLVTFNVADLFIVAGLVMFVGVRLHGHDGRVVTREMQ